jgi:Ribosomal protein L23
MEKTMLLRPRLSEKTFSLASSSVYVFDVPADANKHTVAKAVAAQFGVTVVDVNILNWKGKAKRTIRKGGPRRSPASSPRKKAYVTLQGRREPAVLRGRGRQERRQEDREEG